MGRCEERMPLLPPPARGTDLLRGLRADGHALAHAAEPLNVLRVVAVGQHQRPALADEGKELLTVLGEVLCVGVVEERRAEDDVELGESLDQVGEVDVLDLRRGPAHVAKTRVVFITVTVVAMVAVDDGNTRGRRRCR